MSAPPRTPIPNLAELDLVVETRRLRLRPLVVADADAFWPTVSQREFPKYMSWSAHADKRETVEVIQNEIDALASGRNLVWAIEHAGGPVGVIGLNRITWQQQALRVDRADLGYWLVPASWGQGLMTEAAHGAVQFAFEQLRLHKINVGCIEENIASRRVIQKVGFRQIGRLDEDVWRDGRWWAHLRFELTAAEWSDVSTTMPISRLPLT